MRHHWLLLGACGWVLLILMFVSKFMSFRAVDDYGERAGGQSWTVPGTKVVKPIPVSSPEKQAPKPSDQPSAAPTVGEWQSVAEKRIELLSTACKNSSLRNLTHVSISKFVLDRIFVCDKHKILFCQTPKVGNTQWKKVLIVLNGAFSTVEEIPENLVHDHEKNGLPRLSSLSPQEITHSDKRSATTWTYGHRRASVDQVVYPEGADHIGIQGGVTTLSSLLCSSSQFFASWQVDNNVQCKVMPLL